MKIAIFHNFMDNIGGAEKVCLTLARELKADLYSTNVDEEKIKKMGFGDIKLISIGRIPTNPIFRQQLALAKFRRLNLGNKYNFYIIGGDWALSGAVNNKPNLWYAHSSTKEIWDFNEYTRQNIVPLFARNLFDLWVKYNRYLSRKYIESIGGFVCNSLNTRKRIKKYLQRDAEIIYPPIETSCFYHKTNGNFWLSVNRLINHKRIEMQMEAFRNLPDEKLIIVGSYEQARHFKKYANYIKKIKPQNVKILSWINSDDLTNLYANCRGLIATAKDEDFGMAPVEAMASGKPVIAPNEGGYKETIENGVTGILIDNINANKLAQAVKKIGNDPVIYRQDCLRVSQKFDTKIFVEKIKKFIKS